MRTEKQRFESFQIILLLKETVNGLPVYIPDTENLSALWCASLTYYFRFVHGTLEENVSSYQMTHIEIWGLKILYIPWELESFLWWNAERSQRKWESHEIKENAK